MLYYDRSDVSEGIDVNKLSASKECDICHCWYFLNYSFKFQPKEESVEPLHSIIIKSLFNNLLLTFS